MGAVNRREAFPPGTLVGERYRIVSALARGGFGAVYVAEQLATARPVALKLLTSHVSDVSIERLLAEARIASRVNSEHIVQVYDAGIDPESSLVFVAMELLSGVTLAELLRQRGPRSPGETAEYLRQVALGLDKVHGVVGSDGRPAPIVHRDLKPANLFLTRREDGTAWVKILDFGAAKVLSGEAHSSGVVRGTPEYMAYEQAAGGEITRATDIWAFGLIAFTLLTGRSYWRGAATEAGRAQVFGEVLTVPLERASVRARELGAPAVLDRAFDEWFFRCVNREPSERFASAGEAARALARALGVTVGPLSAPPFEHAAAGSDDAPGPRASSLVTRDLSGVAASSRRTRVPRSGSSAVLIALVTLALLGAVLVWLRPQGAQLERAAADGGPGSSVEPSAARLESAAPPREPVPPATAASSARAAGPTSPALESAAPLTSAVRVPGLARRRSASPSASAASPLRESATKPADPYDVR